MSQAKTFLEKKDSELIKAIGKEDWLNEKVYFVSEIIEFMEEFEEFLNKKNNESS